MNENSILLFYYICYTLYKFCTWFIPKKKYVTFNFWVATFSPARVDTATKISLLY